MVQEPDFEKRGGLVVANCAGRGQRRGADGCLHEPSGVEHTLATGKATYWSTSRNQLWVKGETSGQIQDVKKSASIVTQTPCSSRSTSAAMRRATWDIGAVSSVICG